MTRADAAQMPPAVAAHARTTAVLPQARIAGLCYLAVIAGGLFAEGVVRASLIVHGDAEATALAIAANESLWRSGLAVHLGYLVPAVALNVILYGLFAPVDRTLARLALVFSIVAVTVEAVSLLNLTVPLTMIDEVHALRAIGEGQRHALTYLAVERFATGWGFALLFFAGFCILTGVLIRRSQVVPGIIGTLMVAAGIGYVVNSLAMIVSPALSDALVPWVLLPVLPAELSLAVWLVARGGRAASAIAR